MKLLLVFNFIIFFNEIYQNFYSFTINLMEFCSKFELLQLFDEKIPNVNSRFYVIIRNYTQYMKDFFLINDILSKLKTIYTLYKENLIQYSLMLS
jgi:hypothetical protein